MEFILGLLAGTSGIVITIALIILALGFEHNRAHGWTVFTTVVLGAIAYKAFNLTLLQVGMLAAVWLPIGLVWSFWRWKRHVDKVVSDFEPDDSQQSRYIDPLESAKKKIDPTENIDTITYWVIAWPFSLVEMLLGDVIDAVQAMIKSVFRGTYAKISTKGLAALEQKAK